MADRPAHTFPFSAIVGQDQLKTALILNAIDPGVGGVLIRGEKGTAKSTAVRALANLLPPLEVVEGCTYGCDPHAEPAALCSSCRERRDSEALVATSVAPRVVELPVSATEDRVVGTLDFEAALKQGERAFHPGLLAEAHRSVLYIDEVNLLDDHLVDTLLDSAASGVNVVEREGVSVSHPARFVLVGTMNPEEGELRPQLLDRFGLCVEVAALRDPEQRVEIMRRRRDYDEDPERFVAAWKDHEEELTRRIASARDHVRAVGTSDEVLYAIADLCVRAGVDGHRADTVMARAAAAYAAFEGRENTELRDVEHVARLVLSHRLRRTPFDPATADEDTLRSSIVRALSQASGEGAAVAGDDSPAPVGAGQALLFADDPLGPAEAQSGAEVPVTSGALAQARSRLAGKRASATSTHPRGRYVRAEPPPSHPPATDVALDATIRAAAVGVGTADAGAKRVLTVRPEDVRTKVRMRKVGATIVFCVDASGSMGAASRIGAAKAAILDLLADAYQHRDRVAMVTFRGDGAEVDLAPTASVELAGVRLRQIPTGGATPMAAGVSLACDTLIQERERRPGSIGWMVLVTDGQANVGRAGRSGSDDALQELQRARTSGFEVLVIDTSARPETTSAARLLAERSDAHYVQVNSADAAAIGQAVRQHV